jgi:hypothetical protein
LRQYREDSIAFLCTGQDAPFKSREEILRMPVPVRNYHIRKLSDLYKHQQEEMERIRRK